jgi:hypothetical protein
VNRLWKIVVLLLVAISMSAALSLAVRQKVLAPALAREEAFDAIIAQQLHPIDGVIELPKQWHSASMDGKAYLTGNVEHTLWVLFVEKRSSSGQVRGYLFCNKPAAARVSGVVPLNYPNASSPQIEASVQRILNPNCFEVLSAAPHGASTEPW